MKKGGKSTGKQSSSNLIVDLFDGKATTPNGESLSDIRNFNNQDLEARHDYIQYMFPSPEASSANPDAPVATIDDAKAFAENQKLKDELLLNLTRMLNFWDFDMETSSDGSIKFSLSKKFNSKKAKQVILRGNSKFHNFLRLTRVVKSLHFLGLPQHAFAFQLFLLDVLAGQVKASDSTIEYWRTAIPSTLTLVTGNPSLIHETSNDAEDTEIVSGESTKSDESNSPVKEETSEHTKPSSSGLVKKAEGLISGHIPHLEKIDTTNLMHEAKPLVATATSIVTDHDPSKRKEDEKTLMSTAKNLLHETNRNSDASTVVDDEDDQGNTNEHQHKNSSHLNATALKSGEQTCERICCVIN